MGQSETSGQTYSRWFTEWPSTHERAGQTVEVVAAIEYDRLVALLDREFTDWREWPDV